MSRLLNICRRSCFCGAVGPVSAGQWAIWGLVTNVLRGESLPRRGSSGLEQPHFGLEALLNVCRGRLKERSSRRLAFTYPRPPSVLRGRDGTESVGGGQFPQIVWWHCPGGSSSKVGWTRPRSSGDRASVS